MTQHCSARASRLLMAFQGPFAKAGATGRWEAGGGFWVGRALPCPPCGGPVECSPVRLWGVPSGACGRRGVFCVRARGVCLWVCVYEATGACVSPSGCCRQQMGACPMHVGGVHTPVGVGVSTCLPWCDPAPSLAPAGHRPGLAAGCSGGHLPSFHLCPWSLWES